LVASATDEARSTVPTFQLSDSAKAAPVLDRVTAAFKSLKLLTADFVQVVQNPMTGAPDTTRGKLYQLPPNRFGMRFTAPRGDRLVADGRYLWIYTPSTTPNQVIRAKLQTAGGAAAPNFMGQFADRPHERYRSRYVKAEKGADVINMVPLEKDAPFTEATLAVDSAGIPRRLEFQESSGQRRVLILSGIVLNGNVDFREFTFAVPAGVQVVDQ
jgi:outer membrane lipoprotein carrier protein